MNSKINNKITNFISARCKKNKMLLPYKNILIGLLTNPTLINNFRDIVNDLVSKDDRFEKLYIKSDKDILLHIEYAIYKLEFEIDEYKTELMCIKPENIEPKYYYKNIMYQLLRSVKRDYKNYTEDEDFHINEYINPVFYEMPQYIYEL